MLGLFKSDPKKKLQKAYEAKLEKALHYQRNGDLRTHSTLMLEAESLYAENSSARKERLNTKQRRCCHQHEPNTYV
ncbi:MAG: DUF6435 family protein [Marinobacter sp.]|nr:DUF6435 family protein [Marinobacter sp.]